MVIFHERIGQFCVVQFFTEKLSVGLSSVETIIHFRGYDGHHLPLRPAQWRGLRLETLTILGTRPCLQRATRYTQVKSPRASFSSNVLIHAIFGSPFRQVVSQRIRNVMPYRG